MTPIARELLSPCLAPFGQSSTLPSAAYTDPAVFRWEMEHFFDRTWACVGRSRRPEDPAVAVVGPEASAVDWHGWLFVNRSGDAPAFEDHAGNLGSIVENHRCEELVSGARHDYEIAANWKLVAENYHECYHCPSIHPELCEVSPPTSSDNVHPDGPWIGGPLDLAEGVQTMSLSGESPVPNLPGLTAEQERKTYYFQLFPNILISAHPDYVMTHRLQPLAPDRTWIECEWLFAREVVEERGFDPSYASEFWDITNRQDWTACEAVQRGVASRGYRQGPLSPKEDAVYDLITLVANGYLEGKVARPISRDSLPVA